MKKRIQMIAGIAALGMLASAMTGCGAGGANGAISVITREDGSGTRGAFTELCGIVADDKDNTVSSAEVTNSTAVMLTTVAGNSAAIGYVSMGSLDDSVTAAIPFPVRLTSSPRPTVSAMLHRTSSTLS